MLSSASQFEDSYTSTSSLTNQTLQQSVMVFIQQDSKISGKYNTQCKKIVVLGLVMRVYLQCFRAGVLFLKKGQI